MTTREQVIANARNLVNVGWRRMGRDNAGVDCAGVAVVALRASGYPVEDEAEYPLTGGGRLLEVLRRSFDVVDGAESAEPGDLLAVRVEPSKDAPPSHLMVLTDTRGVVHMDYGRMRVVEITDASRWMRRVVATAKLRGVPKWQP